VLLNTGNTRSVLYVATIAKISYTLWSIPPTGEIDHIIQNHMSKRVIIAAGGTGGHLFPAMALASHIHGQMPHTQVTFMAHGLAHNPRFTKSFPFVDIASAPSFLSGCVHLCRGVCQSLYHLRKMRPDLVVGFGSFHTAPVLLAAKMLSIPFVLHEANAIPGKVNRWLSGWARWTGVFFPAAQSYLRGTTKQVNIPLRKEFLPENQPDKAHSLAYFGFADHKKTILVFGGSQGAQGINDRVVEACEFLQHPKSLRIIHYTGDVNKRDSAAEQYARYGIEAVVKEFEPCMHHAWSLASCFIGRAGAGAIAEQLAFKVPGILIPYPHAADNHQEKNAEYVERVIGGGRCYNEKSLTPQDVMSIVSECFDDISILNMIENINSYVKSSHQEDFCQAIQKELEKY